MCQASAQRQRIHLVQNLVEQQTNGRSLVFVNSLTTQGSGFSQIQFLTDQDMPGNQQMPDSATSGNTGNNTGGNPADCFKQKNPLEDDWVENAKCNESNEVGGCCDRCAEAQVTHNAKCDELRREGEAKLDTQLGVLRT